jgi:integrase
MGTDDTGKDSFNQRSLMQVIKKNNTTFYREKVYLDGKCIHSPRFQRKSDAQNWKARMMSEKSKYLSSGQLPEIFKNAESPLFKDYAKNWLNSRVKLQLATRTFELYSNVLNKHIIPKFGEMRLNQFHIKHGHDLIRILQESGHNPRGINLIVSILKRVIIDAVRSDSLDKNPFQYLLQIKEPPKADVYLSHEEINKVIETSQGHFFHSMFVIAVNTGMRRGEIAGLCWDRVNFDLSLIEITRNRDRNGLGDRTKTIKSRRFIPMNAVVKRHLLELYQIKNSDLVIVDKDGKAFDVNHLFRDFNRFLEKAEINKHFRFHDLRHTFASHFMMNGGNIYDLQKILGHTSLEMTQRYAHLAPEHLVKAANVVSFGAKKKKIAP